MDASPLLVAASVGAALLFAGSLAAVGGARTVRLARQLGLGGLLLALFVGVAVESLAASLVETRPYTLLFLSTGDLRAQALMEDADLRTRYNVDPRLRYIPAKGDRVPNLESEYALDVGPLRTLDFPALVHANPVPTPPGVETLSPFGRSDALRGEVEGLYEAASATVHPKSNVRAELVRTGSVGLLVLGLLGLLAGLPPLLRQALRLGRDAARLASATSHRSYRGVRRRAIRSGGRALYGWHAAEARPFASLATFGLLAALAGGLLGVLREEETRRDAHAVFAEARRMREKGS